MLGRSRPLRDGRPGPRILAVTALRSWFDTATLLGIWRRGHRGFRLRSIEYRRLGDIFLRGSLHCEDSQYEMMAVSWVVGSSAPPSNKVCLRGGVRCMVEELVYLHYGARLASCSSEHAGRMLRCCFPGS
jgi:hypothetical protein